MDKRVIYLVLILFLLIFLFQPNHILITSIQIIFIILITNYNKYGGLLFCLFIIYLNNNKILEGYNPYEHVANGEYGDIYRNSGKVNLALIGCKYKYFAGLNDDNKKVYIYLDGRYNIIPFVGNYFGQSLLTVVPAKAASKLNTAYGIDTKKNVSDQIVNLFMGATGPTGSQGIPIDGAPGPKGPQGPQGIQGPQGAQGPIGSQGADGSQGPTGSDGLPGLVGPAGPAGPAGLPSSDIIGFKGPQGRVGDAGNIGPTGPVGSIIYDNNNIYTGPQGITGDNGPQGPDGPPGPDGPMGSIESFDIMKPDKYYEYKP
jgi:hypothetical protein